MGAVNNYLDFYETSKYHRNRANKVVFDDSSLFTSKLSSLMRSKNKSYLSNIFFIKN